MVFWRCRNHTFAKKHHLFTYKRRAHFRLFAKKHPLFTSKRRALLRPKITLLRRNTLYLHTRGLHVSAFLRRNTLYLHPRGVHCSFLGIWGGFGEALGGFREALGNLWEAFGRLGGGFGEEEEKKRRKKKRRKTQALLLLCPSASPAASAMSIGFSRCYCSVHRLFLLQLLHLPRR